jgi:deazaflavin-dependent oxidoreductase (nitroreductase family)
MYALGLGPLFGRFVLLLTTTGRKSGKARVTPLQYEEIDGVIYIAAARGQRADWFRNLVANPQVEVRVKSRRFRCMAEPIYSPQQIADFLEVRLRRHPRMMSAILRRDGLPVQPKRMELEAYAARLAVVALKPPG